MKIQLTAATFMSYENVWNLRLCSGVFLGGGWCSCLLLFF